MAQVDVVINNRPYRIACDNGQEHHVGQLAEYVDQKVQELVASVGQVGEDRLLVMASLLIADELSETIGALELARETGPEGAEGDSEAPAEVAETMESLADRIERIAAKLEAA